MVNKSGLFPEERRSPLSIRDTLITSFNGNAPTSTQLPPVPPFSRILGSPLSPGLLCIQHQEQETAQPRGVPGNGTTLSCFREIHKDQNEVTQIAVNLVPPLGS
jgi:hypothetical protein